MSLGQDLREISKYTCRLILSPPRSGSTLLAAVLSRSSSVQNYFHEPSRLARKDKSQIKYFKDILNLLESSGGGHGTFLIKEMSHWLKDVNGFKSLVDCIRLPVVVLIRDPVLVFFSRTSKILESVYYKQNYELTSFFVSEGIICSVDAMNTKEAYKEVLDKTSIDYGYKSWIDFSRAVKKITRPSSLLNLLLLGLRKSWLFRSERSGWSVLLDQVLTMERLGIDFVIVDITDISFNPKYFIQQICALWGIKYSKKMLEWKIGEISNFSTGQDLQHQQIWYSELANSTGIHQKNNEWPAVGALPKQIRSKIDSEDIVAYKSIGANPKRLIYPNLDEYNSVLKQVKYSLPVYYSVAKKWLLKHGR